MFDDTGVVKLKDDLPDEGLSAGTVGAIVMVYPVHLNPGLPQSYEVEFCDEYGITLALVTLTEDDLTVESDEEMKTG